MFISNRLLHYRRCCHKKNIFDFVTWIEIKQKRENTIDEINVIVNSYDCMKSSQINSSMWHSVFFTLGVHTYNNMTLNKKLIRKSGSVINHFFVV